MKLESDGTAAKGCALTVTKGTLLPALSPPAGLQAGLAGLNDPSTGQPLKLDIIGFDACLMSMHEVGAVLAPYAKYLLGSELLEPGTGWDYTALSYMVQGVAWDGDAIADAAVGYTEVNLANALIGGYLVSGG